MPDDQNARDAAPDSAEVSLISGLTGGLTDPGGLSSGHSAEQGDAPADAASRPAPALQPTSRQHLSAAEVEALTGVGEGSTQDSDVSES